MWVTLEKEERFMPLQEKRRMQRMKTPLNIIITIIIYYYETEKTIFFFKTDECFYWQHVFKDNRPNTREKVKGQPLAITSNR